MSEWKQINSLMKSEKKDKFFDILARKWSRGEGGYVYKRMTDAFINGNGDVMHGNLGDEWQVTHWMPIPKPPKSSS
jgi:hypothetical protein